MDFCNIKKPIISAHRGDKANFPENTMEAFESAVNMGVDMIETDIHLTRDNKLVLIHDHSVDRTTDGTGKVSEKTYDELKLLNAGTCKSPSHIPTLEEFLAYVSPVDKMLLNLEIKVYLNEEGEERVDFAVDETIKLCKKYHVEKRVMFNSFDAYVLEYINKNHKNQFILHGFYPYSNMSNITANPDEYLDYACYWATGEEAKNCCDYLISKNIIPCTGSDTSEDTYKEAVSFGCAMFTENDPKKFLKFR